MSKADCPPQCAWASFSQFKALREKAEVPKEEGILPPDCFWAQAATSPLPWSPAYWPALQILGLSTPAIMQLCNYVNQFLKINLFLYVHTHIHLISSVFLENSDEHSLSLLLQGSECREKTTHAGRHGVCSSRSREVAPPNSTMRVTLIWALKASGVVQGVSSDTVTQPSTHVHFTIVNYSIWHHTPHVSPAIREGCQIPNSQLNTGGLSSLLKNALVLLFVLVKVVWSLFSSTAHCLCFEACLLPKMVKSNANKSPRGQSAHLLCSLVSPSIKQSSDPLYKPNGCLLNEKISNDGNLSKGLALCRFLTCILLLTLTALL